MWPLTWELYFSLLDYHLTRDFYCSPDRIIGIGEEHNYRCIDGSGRDTAVQTHPECKYRTCVEEVARAPSRYPSFNHARWGRPTPSALHDKVTD